MIEHLCCPQRALALLKEALRTSHKERLEKAPTLAAAILKANRPPQANGVVHLATTGSTNDVLLPDCSGNTNAFGLIGLLKSPALSQTSLQASLAEQKMRYTDLGAANKERVIQGQLVLLMEPGMALQDILGRASEEPGAPKGCSPGYEPRSKPVFRSRAAILESLQEKVLLLQSVGGLYKARQMAF